MKNPYFLALNEEMFDNGFAQVETTCVSPEVFPNKHLSFCVAWNDLSEGLGE